jgi:thioredoxin reductase
MEMPNDVDPLPGEFDVVIVGAGPAGLSAALILGRCRRKVLLCDRGTPRSWASKAMYGFISRDGVAPAEFAAIARAELKRYSNVVHEPSEVQCASPGSAGFTVVAGTRTVHARKLLIATGVEDSLPDIDGCEALFGISVFQCPYCDGWEFRDRPLAAYGRRGRGFEMARALTAWTRDIVLCTDGRSGFTQEQQQQLEENGIRVIQKPVLRLERKGGKLSHLVFSDGSTVEREAMFFDTPSRGQSNLARQLGCTFTRHGGVLCGKYEATAVPGVYVAGNIIRNVQLSIVAAAEGASAAFGINRALTREDFIKRATGSRVVEHTAP